MKIRSSKIILSILLTLLSINYSSIAGAYPEKPFEFVVHSAPGGGSDVFTRIACDILEKNRIISTPLTVQNKAGGGGAIATSYVVQKKGDPYTLLAVMPTILTVLSSKRAKTGIEDVTPISRLIIESNLFVVRYDAPYKDMRDLIASGKKTPRSISFGIGSIGSIDHMIAHRIQKVTGVEFNIVSFKSGAEATTAMLGGHVISSGANPSEFIELYKAKKVRALGLPLEKRIPDLPEIPTYKEQGIDIIFPSFRGFIAPAGISNDTIKYLESSFKKLMETDRWKKYMKENYWVEGYLNSEEFRKFMKAESERYSEDLKEMGLLK